jgi:WhiB family redox-sensing transcriptional regulator
MEEASCAQVDPELWYPERGGPSARAKAICNGTDKIKPCPVRLQCLGYAMENHEIHGIWGGLSEVERAQLRRGTPA